MWRRIGGGVRGIFCSRVSNASQRDRNFGREANFRMLSRAVQSRAIPRRHAEGSRTARNAVWTT